MALDPLFLSRPLAHRGLHDLASHAPENTIEAFRRAISHGYGIELDVQISLDGEAMVFHDYVLDRLTDATGPTRQKNAAALGQIRLTGGTSTIPTLAQVLAEVAGRAPVLIEIKDQDGALGPATGPLEHAIARNLSAYDGPVAVMSFNPHAIAIIHALLPDLSVGLVTGGFYEPWWYKLSDQQRQTLKEIPDIDRVGGCFISHDQTCLDFPRVAELKRAGLAILSWTIRSAAQERAARKVADNITFEGYLPKGALPD